jgi:hypothetical protein
MAKKWYHYLVTPEQTGTVETAVADADAPRPEPTTADPTAIRATGETAAAALPAFEEIYASAQITAPAHGYTILKVADMLRSEHIASLPPDVKKKSVLLALEAAGVSLDSIIDDAVRRDRALDTFERTQDKTLGVLERQVQADARRWQQEIDALIAELHGKMRAAQDAFTREAAAVRQWKEQKGAEEARIAEAVGHFLPENPITIGPPSNTPSSKG